MIVPVERYIEQVRDGSRYKGTLKIADTTLDYELTFTVPLPDQDDREPVTTWEEVRHLVHIVVKRDRAEIELTNKEYRLFFHMLAQFAIDFYNNPQTRDSNEGFLGMLLRRQGPLASIGATSSIGISSSGTYDFSPAHCEILTSPKFGCALAT